MTGEHLQPACPALNPNGMVALLDDAGFRLTQSSAILKYLAEKTGSPACPVAPRERARLNGRVGWLNANPYRNLGFHLVYPQLFPHHPLRSTEGNDAASAWGREGSRHWLSMRDRSFVAA